MSVVKNIVKAGIGTGAAVMGVGALVYEGALNTKLLTVFKSIFHKPDPEVEGLYEGDYYVKAGKWFDEHKCEDKVVRTEKAGNAHAYVIYADEPSEKWVVLPHGYSSAPEGTCVYAMEYHAMGYNCVSISMRGYANDEAGYCSMGWHDKDIGLAWVDWIIKQDPEAKIVIHGYSMGAATTMLMTGEPLPENVKCAVSDCGYTNVYEQYTYVLKANASIPPFPLLDAANAVSKLRGNFDFKKTSPIDAIRHSVTPTLFLHGTKDDFVPFFMLDKVYDACAAEKEKVTIEDAKHAVSVLKDPEKYWNAVKSFLAKYVP